jgi:hypothetical protein
MVGLEVGKRMFLLTFVLMIVAILGTYTQVYALATARIFASQTGVASEMIAWHNAALSVANNVVTSPTVVPMGLTGCSLSKSLGTPAKCPTAPTVSGPSTAYVGGTVPYTYNVGAQSRSLPYLSSGYNSAVYEWKSIAFQMPPNNGYYVVTYIDPTPAISATNPAPGLLNSGSAVPRQLGVSANDLTQQLRLTGIPVFAFGTVKNPTNSAATMTPTSITPVINTAYNGTPITVVYNLPPTIKDGSVAIISSASSCPGC